MPAPKDKRAPRDRIKGHGRSSLGRPRAGRFRRSARTRPVSSSPRSCPPWQSLCGESQTPRRSAAGCSRRPRRKPQVHLSGHRATEASGFSGYAAEAVNPTHGRRAKQVRPQCTPHPKGGLIKGLLSRGNSSSPVERHSGSKLAGRVEPARVQTGAERLDESIHHSEKDQTEHEPSRRAVKATSKAHQNEVALLSKLRLIWP